ncbi:uncharacterized protein LOC107434233 isoform X1 [Ziziphus jujuba]|uniref:Uncharacterized protein LOC107434233 isoform X1 n=2 Tax=Ziziphus jujuba TaxID=326968 RepID=A0A6P4AV83_ZIZJJ|nr:uncharacterized protein LOC107434233 isoform X1 [Ziziphus jujuba]XP_048336384.2 uncharacterized protein LOC107434233 isoform X1 [Ziziphus jujuba]XP_048336385.2 uncharacterized protein LOC107434233 isoform X1 [Ziziphus jujuba]
MGWSHPDISLGDLMELIKGFVDILILASGYQLSGRLAHWDTQNIKKAFQWAIFFENVLRTLSCLDDYQDSVKELDEALSKMTSAPSFPQGFAHLSSATLSTARAFVLAHFIHTLPLRDAHLRVFLMAAIEMDIDELSGAENDCLHTYLNKLKQQNAFINSVPTRRHNDSAIMSENLNLVSEIGKCIGDSFTKYAVQELLKRWFPVSCVLAIEKGLDIVSDKIKYSSWNNFDDNLFKEQLRNEDAPVIVEQLVGFLTWNRWKSKSLTYFLDKRTVRMVSGASMIFSAPKVQWIQVFERLNISTESSDDDFCETVELLLLGCITSRWTYLIEHLMSISYNSKTISEQYQEVFNLLPVRYQAFDSGEETVSLKEIDILEYLTGLLEGQLHQLWKISPALAAIAIPSWSPLFRLYLSEMESQLRGCSSTLRCCSCSEGMEHNDCELAERIWCLYIFHVCGSCQTLCAGSS